MVAKPLSAVKKFFSPRWRLEGRSPMSRHPEIVMRRIHQWRRRIFISQRSNLAISSHYGAPRSRQAWRGSVTGAESRLSESWEEADAAMHDRAGRGRCNGDDAVLYGHHEGCIRLPFQVARDVSDDRLAPSLSTPADAACRPPVGTIRYGPGPGRSSSMFFKLKR